MADPILANPLADLTATEGEPLTFTVPANAFTDADAGDSLSYAARLADGSVLPAWLGFDAPTRTLSGTPPSDAGGLLTLRVNATDTGGATASSPPS